DLLKILEKLHAGALTPAKAAGLLRHLPFEDIGFAKVDHHRALRQGYAEVIFGKGKTPAQVAQIVRAMTNKKSSTQNVLVTRADSKMFAAVKRVARSAKFHPLSGVITIERTKTISGKGSILVVSAGTSDIPVAEEALLTAKIMGNRVAQIFDVGVAGIVAVPVIAVPTSTGYGASFGGVAALLGMLNSCASNVTVVNIDNGFGAACVASCINRL